MSVRKEQLAENVTVWLGDCREVVPTIDVPAVIISDPPYGVAYKSAGRMSFAVLRSRTIRR